MITVTQCALYAGLASNELLLGAGPSVKHYSLLSRYLLNLGRNPQVVRDMIVADLRASLELGTSRRAADLLIVLRLFLFDYPEARERSDVTPIPLSPNASDVLALRQSAALPIANAAAHPTPKVINLERRAKFRYA